MGKKGKKGKKSGKTPALESSHSDLDELSKEFYLIQVHDLETRVARYCILDIQFFSSIKMIVL
jgi:hypothetical protein